MELRPRLRRNYATTNLPEVYAPVLAPHSGGPIPNGAVEIDGRAYHGLVLDFGPSSVDGWLTRIAAAELGLPEDDLLDMRQRQLLVDGQRIELTSLEFEVLHYLRQHEGATVPRYALLTRRLGIPGRPSGDLGDDRTVRLRGCTRWRTRPSGRLRSGAGRALGQRIGHHALRHALQPTGR